MGGRGSWSAGFTGLGCDTYEPGTAAGRPSAKGTSDVRGGEKLVDGAPTLLPPRPDPRFLRRREPGFLSGLGVSIALPPPIGVSGAAGWAVDVAGDVEFTVAFFSTGPLPREDRRRPRLGRSRSTDSPASWGAVGRSGATGGSPPAVAGAASFFGCPGGRREVTLRRRTERGLAALGSAVLVILLLL